MLKEIPSNPTIMKFRDCSVELNHDWHEEVVIISFTSEGYYLSTRDDELGGIMHNDRDLLEIVSAVIDYLFCLLPCRYKITTEKDDTGGLSICVESNFSEGCNFPEAIGEISRIIKSLSGSPRY